MSEEKQEQKTEVGTNETTDEKKPFSQEEFLADVQRQILSIHAKNDAEQTEKFELQKKTMEEIEKRIDSKLKTLDIVQMSHGQSLMSSQNSKDDEIRKGAMRLIEGTGLKLTI